MKSRSSSLTSGFLIVIILVAGMTLIMPVSADNIQTVVVPDTMKYSLPPLQVNNSMEPVVLNQELSTEDQPGIYRIPTGSVILYSDDGVNRVFDAGGIQFLAVYDTGAHHTHSVPNGGFVDSEGNITYILSNNLLIMTIIDATGSGIATPTLPPIVASFAPMPPNEGNPPLNVQFSDYSQGTITGWNWSFGDGSGSTEQYPVHTYRINGTYNVTLTVHGPQGIDTFTYPECITVGPRPPLARIGADPQRADYAPLTVTFIDTSLGDITSWLWNFGDGSTSTEQNPVHTFRKQGNFSVSLTVAGPAGTSTLEQPVFILVGPFPPVAYFEAIYTSHPAPCSVEFMQYSEGTITGWLWDFGDGTKSAEQKPTHTYYRNGNFTVNLTVSGPEGTSTKSRSSFIHVGEPFFISADPMGIHSVGETFTITGTTNLPVGEDLDYYVMTGSFNPGGPRFGNPSNASGTARVVTGNSKNNSWSFTLDTKEFQQDEYLVDLHSTTFNDVYGSFVFTLVKGKRMMVDNSNAALATLPQQSSITQIRMVEPTKQPAPFSVIIPIFALCCISLITVRPNKRRKRR